jgi:conjugative relaxase-like TrwC/TraI family protein
MRVMSSGDGYRYLLKSVAAGDGDRALSTPLTRYYTEVGNPAGWWIGGGLPSLGDDAPAVRDEVTEQQLQLLIGSGRHPVSGEPLGRAYSLFIGSGARRAVAGFDFTFSVPKSASVLWAVADAPTQASIVAAHHRAVAEVVAFMEREVAATRVGASDGTGAVAQMDVTGLIATAFDHFDSRAGDPHLHTHVVVSNKVQTALDGKWRALDGRPMHAAVVALSELHEALFADELTRTLGVAWERRDRGRDRNPGWDIRGVPAALLETFSARSTQINATTDELIDRYVTEHGRRPRPAVIVKLRQQATLSTRPEKHVRSLADLTASWRTRASAILGGDATAWTRSIVDGEAPAVVRAVDVSDAALEEMGREVVEVVGEKRSTWRHWNLAAEAARQSMDLRFATATDREAVVSRIVVEAERVSLRLTPPEHASTPSQFRRPDGSSRFRPAYSMVYSSQRLLDLEDELLVMARDTSAPTVNSRSLAALTQRGTGDRMGADQVAALASVASSGRRVDVLVGPAGSGKSTAMRSLRQVWEAQRGVGSVIGLAPSAAAAAVLGVELGVQTENTAKWLHDHPAGSPGFRGGQLVIVDEASLAGTATLHRIAARAAAAGAKLLLVGDAAQLQAVDAGGAFALLVSDRADPPTLSSVHRFTHDWEKAASLALRAGDPAVLDAYEGQARIVGAESESVTESAYIAWQADTAAGRISVLIAEAGDTVRELNLRARDDRVRVGTVAAGAGLALHDGTHLSAGDAVITRRNDRLLRTRASWVRNGDRWTVTKVRGDGSIAVRQVGRRRGAVVVLPAGYVAEHVELGYAITAHRAQGITVDTAHAVITATSTRESLYVAMTRGRESNIAYVATDRPDTVHTAPHPADDPTKTARSVLTGVLAHVGAQQSAHANLRTERDKWGSIAQLAAEYDTIATAAQHDRWVALIRSSPLTAGQSDAVVASAAFGPLAATLRRAEAHHHDVDALLARVVTVRGFEDADDIAAVLDARIIRATARRGGTSQPTQRPLLIAGLIPEARGSMDAEMRQALDQRRHLIEQRAVSLADAAIDEHAPWMRALGTPPTDAGPAAEWQRHAQTVAAYRDKYAITGNRPLGVAAESDLQRLDAFRASTAVFIAQRIATAGESTWISARDLAIDPRGMSR